MVDRIGQQLGNYHLIRFLGRGGFAEVYLGKDVYHKNEVAVKVLDKRLTNERDLREFLNEARSFRLKHPHIVQLLDFGVESDVAFLVMDYASNGTLRYPKGRYLLPESLLPFVKQITAALQYIHDEKLVHRDIKPENLLVGSNNQVLLSDFGIAIAAPDTFELKQEAFGTIDYMPPEQIQGKPCPASDQYSLAIVIYEWLCGERPFNGSSSKAIVLQHLYTPPPSLRGKIPTIPPAVEEVVLIALRKDSQRRFASVRAFAHALEQACSTEPSTVVAPLPSSLVPDSRVPSGRDGVGITSPLPTVLPSALCPPTVLVKQPLGTCLYTHKGHKNFVHAVAWSPSGLRIASGSDDRTVQVWDALTGNNVFTYCGHRTQVWAVTWSPDGKYIVSGTARQIAQVWSATKGNNGVTYSSHIASPISLRFVVVWSPDGKHIASGGADTTVHVWEAATGSSIFIYRSHFNEVNALAWSPDGKRIASGGADTTVHVWEATTGKNAFTHSGHAKEVYAVAWSPDGRCVASASRDTTVQVWDATTGDRIFTYGDHERRVRALAWSPDGKRIASVDDDKVYGGPKSQDSLRAKIR